MTRTIKILLGTVLLVTIVGYFVFLYFTQESRDWDFIQKVGGIKTENPLETQDGFYLPVICNVSGTDSITVKPTQLNSALVCTNIHVKHINDKIYLTIITGLPISSYKTCNCKAVNIGRLKNGLYKVYYKDKSSTEHEIGQFDVVDND